MGRVRVPSLCAGAALACVLVCAAPVHAQLSRDPDYQQGKRAYEAHDWAAATRSLAKYLAPGNDRATYEVAYWLGTSWCRMPGDEAVGADTLGWGLSFKQMPEAARPQFAEELKKCLGWIAEQAAQRQLPALLAAANNSGPATLRATGKTYAVAGDKGSLAAYPVRMKRPIKIADLEARLTPAGQGDQAAKVAAKLAPGARLHVSRYVVLASLSQHSPQSLARIGAALDSFVDFLNTEYGLAPPPWVMTIYVFPDIPTLRTWADRIHGLDASPMTLGYAFENDQSILAMLKGEGAGTLLHELFHLVVRNSYASVPQWLDEGIASLYETSTRTEQRFFGEPNWRSPVFKEMRIAFQGLHLRDVITAPWFSDEPRAHQKLNERVFDVNEQAYLLAYARLFTLYLQEQGQLKTVLDTFRARKAPERYTSAQDQAVALLQSALGKTLPEVEADFMKWVPQVYDPERRLHTGQQLAKELPQIHRE